MDDEVDDLTQDGIEPKGGIDSSASTDWEQEDNTQLNSDHWDDSELDDLATGVYDDDWENTHQDTETGEADLKAVDPSDDFNSVEMMTSDSDEDWGATNSDDDDWGASNNDDDDKEDDDWGASNNHDDSVTASVSENNDDWNVPEEALENNDDSWDDLGNSSATDEDWGVTSETKDDTSPDSSEEDSVSQYEGDDASWGTDDDSLSDQNWEESDPGAELSDDLDANDETGWGEDDSEEGFKPGTDEQIDDVLDALSNDPELIAASGDEFISKKDIEKPPSFVEKLNSLYESFMKKLIHILMIPLAKIEPLVKPLMIDKSGLSWNDWASALILFQALFVLAQIFLISI